jgi:hypothetical protein
MLSAYDIVSAERREAAAYLPFTSFVLYIPFPFIPDIQDLILVPPGNRVTICVSFLTDSDSDSDPGPPQSAAVVEALIFDPARNRVIVCAFVSSDSDSDPDLRLRLRLRLRLIHTSTTQATWF